MTYGPGARTLYRRKRRMRAHILDWLSEEVVQKDYGDVAEQFDLTTEQAEAIAADISAQLHRRAVGMSY